MPITEVKNLKVNPRFIAYAKGLERRASFLQLYWGRYYWLITHCGWVGYQTIKILEWFGFNRYRGMFKKNQKVPNEIYINIENSERE